MKSQMEPLKAEDAKLPKLTITKLTERTKLGYHSGANLSQKLTRQI